MTETIRQLRAKGIPTLLAASALIIMLLGFNHYLDLSKDDENAQMLVERELRIVELNIMHQLGEIETLTEDLTMATINHLDQPDRMYYLTKEIMEESDFILGTAIGFAPFYYAEKGQWFEPRCVRRNGELVTEQIGSREHDYHEMEWYRLAITERDRRFQWTAPYIDHSQNDSRIISLCRPIVVHQEKIVGAICIDVSLQKMQELLKEAKPYPGSICQLLDEKGRLLVTSDATAFNDKDYFISSKGITQHHIQIRMACPKSAIYGPTTTRNVTTWIVLLAGFLLLVYIVQRSFHDIINLNTARQQQQNVAAEMQIAHDIQMNILRHDFPKDISAALLPMKEVGGDLYDFHRKGDCIFFIIGDVSGKGLPAAMTMAGTVVLFRMAARHFDTPQEIVTEINSVLSERNPSLIFVTATVGKIDLRHGLLTFCNAGHNLPILNGRLLETDPDIPLGIDKDYAYTQHGALFQEGAQLVLYTDGITEARNQERQFLGTERLLDIVGRLGKTSVKDTVRIIIDNTHRFAGSAEQADDITLMCIANTMPAQSPSIVISNETGNLQSIKLLVREFCDCMGCDKRMRHKIQLAVEEAVTNVINYAYPKGELGNIEINMQALPPQEHHNGLFTVAITDSGKPFNPLDSHVDIEQAIEKQQVGGLGIYLYRQLMDTVNYSRSDDGHNVLTMTKIIEPISK